MKLRLFLFPFCGVLAGAMPVVAQCSITGLATQSVMPSSCQGAAQLVVALQASTCTVQSDFMLPPPSPNTSYAFFVLGLGWSAPTAPCGWLPVPAAALLLPASVAPSWSIPLPPNLPPTTFIVQGAFVIASTISSAVGIGQAGTLSVSLF